MGWQSDPVAPTSGGWQSDPVAESQGMDLLKSIPHYGDTFASSILGAPGDITKLARYGLENLGLGDSSNNMKIWGSQEMQDQVDKNRGYKQYAPQTPLGQGIDTAAALAPAALTGGGSLPAKLATRALLPAAASQTAYEATKGTGYEDIAKTVAMLATPGALNKGIKMRLQGIENEAGPSAAMIKGKEKAAYALANMSGTKVDRNAFIDFMRTDLDPLIDRFGNAPTMKLASGLQPKVREVLNKMTAMVDTGEDVPLGMVQAWRKDMGKAMHTDPNGAGFMYGAINRWARNPNFSQVLKGPDAQFAAEAWRAADKLHGYRKNAEKLEAIFGRALNRKANYTMAGEEGGIRQNFRAWADKLVDVNSKEHRFASPDQMEAVLDVTRGGGRYSARNITKALGTFQPKGMKGAQLLAGPLAALGIYSNPAIGIPLVGAMGAGAMGAKIASHVMTKRKAMDAARLLTTGEHVKKIKGDKYPWWVALQGWNQYQGDK